MQLETPNIYETTSFRTVGYVGAALCALAPPAFVYEMYLMFFTTAIETNPTVGIFAWLSLVLSFVSIPLIIVGRRKCHSTSPTTANLLQVRRAARATAMKAGSL